MLTTAIDVCNCSDGCLGYKSSQPIRDGSEHCPDENLEMGRWEILKTI
jgi:hypothetical protein